MNKIVKEIRRNKISIFVTCFFILYIGFIASFIKYAFHQRDIITAEYENAMMLFEEENYEEALEIFIDIQSYRDVDEYILESKYNLAIAEYENHNYGEAEKIFTELGDYKDSVVYLAQISIENIEASKSTVYERANSYFEQEYYEEAMVLYETILEYKDSLQMAEECKAQLMRRNLNNILAAGARTSVAIIEGNKVVAVGDNDDKQCEVGDWENIVSVDTYGCFTIGLTVDNKVELAGVYDGKAVDISEWEDIVDVAAGERFIVGLNSNGDVIADGHGDAGQLEVSTWEKVIAIDAGWSFTVGLTEDKELLFAGIDNGQKEEFEKNKDQWVDVVNISAGGGGSKFRGNGHTVGLKSDGTVVAVGDNTFGQCNVSEWEDIVKVVAGDWYTVGLHKDGYILITGQNEPGYKYIEYEALELCTDIVDIAAGYGHTLCLHEDGTVTAFGFDDNNKCSGTVEWDEIMLPEIKKK